MQSTHHRFSRWQDKKFPEKFSKFQADLKAATALCVREAVDVVQRQGMKFL